MKNFRILASITAFGFMLEATAIAQSPAATPTSKAEAAQAEAGEPRATTSAGPSTPTPTPTLTPTSTASAAPTSTPPAKGVRPKSGKGGKNAADRVDLDTTTVTGNRELPKVMYVVPWKRSDIGDLIGRPANSLLDEVLAPVDRNVFRREVQYYQALKPDSAASAPQGEK